MRTFIDFRGFPQPKSIQDKFGRSEHGSTNKRHLNKEDGRDCENCLNCSFRCEYKQIAHLVVVSLAIHFFLCFIGNLVLTGIWFNFRFHG